MLVLLAKSGPPFLLVLRVVKHTHHPLACCCCCRYQAVNGQPKVVLPGLQANDFGIRSDADDCSCKHVMAGGDHDGLCCVCLRNSTSELANIINGYK